MSGLLWMEGIQFLSGSSNHVTDIVLNSTSCFDSLQPCCDEKLKFAIIELSPVASKVRHKALSESQQLREGSLKDFLNRLIINLNKRV